MRNIFNPLHLEPIHKEDYYVVQHNMDHFGLLCVTKISDKVLKETLKELDLTVPTFIHDCIRNTVFSTNTTYMVGNYYTESEVLKEDFNEMLAFVQKRPDHYLTACTVFDDKLYYKNFN